VAQFTAVGLEVGDTAQLQNGIYQDRLVRCKTYWTYNLLQLTTVTNLPAIGKYPWVIVTVRVSRVEKLVSKNCIAIKRGTQPNLTTAGRMNFDLSTAVDTSGGNIPIVNTTLGSAAIRPF
jgi:hypothetical protein